MGPHVFKYRSPKEQLAAVNQGKLSLMALDFEHYGGGPITYRQHKLAALKRQALSTLSAQSKFCLTKKRNK